MKIAVCDDEKEIRDLLAEKVSRLYPLADLLLFKSGEELLLTNKEADILLLDIQMSGKNGLETAGELRKKDKDIIIIFVTALEDFVFQAFDVGAFHYLVKPFDDKKFENILKNAVMEVEVRKCRKSEDSSHENRNLLIMAGGKHITVAPSEIIYAEVFDRKIILHTTREDIEYYGKMKELYKKVGEDFYRPHRAFLVNFNYIRKYDGTTIYLEKGQALMAKQNYKDFVRSYLRYNQRKGKSKWNS